MIIVIITTYLFWISFHTFELLTNILEVDSVKTSMILMQVWTICPSREYFLEKYQELLVSGGTK